jgi:oxygen-dependent protoporphyrinogen oxidase
MADVIVFGAGVSGLAAAQRLASQGVDVQVVEKSATPGGYMRTIARDGWRHEAGPNSFLGSAAAMMKLADDVGVPPLAARPAASKRYLFLDGALQSVPSNPIALLTTPLLPASAKLRLLAEPFTGSRPTETDSIREFFEHRLGKEATDRFIDAFVSGIYADDISEVGVAAAFPKIYEMVVKHGSLTRAAAAALGGPRGEKPAVRGTFSFAGGLGDLPAAIADQLGDRLHLGVDVSLERDGDGWRAGDLRAPAVILATPAWAAAKLLGSIAPPLARELEKIHYNPVAGVHLLYRLQDVPVPLDGFGFLTPRREGISMLGCIWSSAMFKVCDDDHAAFTCFIGGAHHPGAVSLSDEALVQQVHGDMQRTMRIQAAPVDTSIVRHSFAIPHYGRNHLATRREIRRLVQQVQGLALASNYLEGVSMNDAIVQGESAAAEVGSFLGSQRKAA